MGHVAIDESKRDDWRLSLRENHSVASFVKSDFFIRYPQCCSTIFSFILVMAREIFKFF